MLKMLLLGSSCGVWLHAMSEKFCWHKFGNFCRLQSWVSMMDKFVVLFALFFFPQVNKWLNWLEEAESDSGEEADWLLGMIAPNPVRLQPPSMGTIGCKWTSKQPASVLMLTKIGECHRSFKTPPQLSNLWWMPNSVCMGFDNAMKMGSSRRFIRYPTTYVWVSSRLPFTVD